ncbi:flagellar motor switch protein FliM [Verrucomicrobia bacterium]|nr:flagellar motor switch protein FliM [Verrucomicrobiota bacterium]MDB4689927.1 flagellar motor switch protein FliM [Verrucomicrobiota bacterium]
MDETSDNPGTENLNPEPKSTSDDQGASQQDVTVIRQGGARHTRNSNSISAFDFDGTSALTPLEMRKLNQIHEDFVNSLIARLSLFLRIEIDMQMEPLESTKMRNGLNKMDETTHLSLVRMAPLRGHSIVELPLPLSLSIVDRLMGGPAELQSSKEKLNDVEVTLLDDVVNIIILEWANIWAHLTPIQPSIVSHESNPKYLSSSSLNSAALQLTIQTTMGDCKEPIRIIIPHLTLEPLVGALSKMDFGDDDGKSNSQIQAPDWCDRFDSVQVDLSTSCRGPKISLKEMSNLRPGQFLPINSSFFETAVLKVAGKQAFKGSIGKINKKWAFKITQNLEK